MRDTRSKKRKTIKKRGGMADRIYATRTKTYCCNKKTSSGSILGGDNVGTDCDSSFTGLCYPTQNNFRCFDSKGSVDKGMYLSTNKSTREYINPCLEYKFIDNHIFTIFPIFNGYSLFHLKKYLLDIKHKNYYKLLFHLIKVILHGLAKIHQHNIAHQNINENSILVSTYTNNNEIHVKFTDFGLGCGVQNNYLSKFSYNLNNCNQNPSQNPMKITNNIIKGLSSTDYLSIAQKTDIINLCSIFIKLLLFFEKIELDSSKGYNDNIKEQIKTIITNKFLSQIEKYRKNKSSNDYDSLLLINTNHETKRDILEYLNIFNDYILCEDKNIKDCQYILDKLIIYEKYKNEKF